MLTQLHKQLIFDALVEFAEAPENLREMFYKTFPECNEFRFIGNLGFGGKIHYRPYKSIQNQVQVDYYPEHENKFREKIIKDVNAQISHIILYCDENNFWAEPKKADEIYDFFHKTYELYLCLRSDYKKKVVDYKKTGIFTYTAWLENEGEPFNIFLYENLPNDIIFNFVKR